MFDGNHMMVRGVREKKRMINVSTLRRIIDHQTIKRNLLLALDTGNRERERARESECERGEREDVHVGSRMLQAFFLVKEGRSSLFEEYFCDHRLFFLQRESGV